MPGKMPFFELQIRSMKAREIELTKPMDEQSHQFCARLSQDCGRPKVSGTWGKRGKVCERNH
jgi:hypothetical protein